MKKKILVLLVVLLLLALSIQVAFAHHDPKPKPPHQPTGGSCNMSWWEPGDGPGNANGVEDGERGMYNVHFGTNPAHGDQGLEEGQRYTKGATHMDNVTTAHCGEE